MHPEIETSITVVVARNNEEAARIERGEDVTQLREEPTEAEAAVIAAEAFFEPEAAEALRSGEGADETETTSPPEKS